MTHIRSSSLLILAVAACAHAPANQGMTGPATPAAAKAFTDKLDQDLLKLTVNSSTAEWIKSTYITDDTERNAATNNDALLGYTAAAIKEAARFDGLKLEPDTQRKLYLLKVSSPVVAPENPREREELTTLGARLEGMYGSGKDSKGRDLQQLEEILRTNRDYDAQLDAWTSWRTISPPMKPLYSRFVELANKGAREIHFANTGDLWRAAYDMPPADFEKETDRLWQQVKPLYDDLQCYVRNRLAKRYPGKMPADGTIPAHLVGNMWSQTWENIYPLVEPYPGEASLDVSDALVKQNYTPIKMAKLAESFFTSLGLDPLPQTFWERSLFTKPRDREVVCHASAWDVTYNNDLRIKMCIRQNEEDLVTLHHEIGHDYYFHAYYKLPVLFQSGANDGFHEAIGDTIALSVTPGYYQRVGLLQSAPHNEKALINEQLKRALEKVAFLPFGLLIDKWRWEVFSGQVTPAQYNQSWWTLVRKYQGISPPTPRGEEFFDPGAKYHIAADVPYMRYFLADILQFQFHRALCQISGHKGALHECSIYGNKEAGQRLNAMLALGASKPWPDALEVLTGQRQMDATAILEYFAPLQKWLKEQNAGQQCGWQ